MQYFLTWAKGSWTLRTNSAPFFQDSLRCRNMYPIFTPLFYFILEKRGFDARGVRTNQRVRRVGLMSDETGIPATGGGGWVGGWTGKEECQG